MIRILFFTIFSFLLSQEYPLNLFNYAGEYNGHSYYISKEKMSVTEAIDLTSQNGGHLVTISDQAENDFITSFADEMLPYTENLRIGLSEAGSVGDWYWLNGEPLTYTSWAESFNENENYASLNPHIHNGGWVDTLGESPEYTGIEFSNTEEVSGCTDELACNYNSDANTDDDSCDYSCHDNGDYSLSFDGVDDYVDCGYGFNNIEFPISIYAKVKIENNEKFDIFQSDTDTFDTYSGVWLVHYDNSFELGYGDGNGTGVNHRRSLEVNYSLDSNEFEIVGVINGPDSMYIYINGENVGGEYSGYATDMNHLGYTSTIGSSEINDPNEVHYGKGLVENIIIYNKSLSNTDVEDYNPMLHEDSEFAHYKFNQGLDGTYPQTLIDHSDNQNHGTIYGAEWVENIENCTDELACNYNEEGSCDYECYNSSDYLIFDGDNDWVNFSGNSVIPSSDAFTIQARVLARNIFGPNGNGYANFIAQGANGNNFFMGHYDDDNLLGSIRIGQWHPQIAFPKDEWVNISYVQTEERSYLFINNELVADTNEEECETWWNQPLGCTIYFPDESADLKIGKQWGNDIEDWNGLMDYIKISPFALFTTTEEINNYEYDVEDFLAIYEFKKRSDNQNSNILIDHSGNNNHGEIIGALWSVEGCTDQLACNYNSNANLDNGSCDYSCHDNGDYSLSFDGDDYVVLQDIDSYHTLDSTDSFTYSIWIFSEESDRNQGIIQNDYNDNSYYGFALRKYASNNTLWLSSNTFNNVITCQTEIELNKWYHIVLLKEENNIKIYVNGELDGESNEIYETFGSNGIDLMLGEGNTDANEKFHGRLDDFKIWNFALSYSEISELYENNFSNNSHTANYLFNQGNEGNYPANVIDHSGNQNHGTIYGAEWIENIENCTDELACNYTEEGSCDYSCHDNGDYSLSFDGDVDHVLINNPIDLSYSNQMSIMLWMNGSDITTEELNTLIRQDYGEPNWSLQFSDYGENINFNIESENNDGENFNLDFLVDPNIFENQTNNLSITYDGQYQNMYINGSLVASNLTNGGNIAFSESALLAIGTHPTTGLEEESYNGKISEISIWDIALDSTQIQNNMINELSTDNQNLVSYWKFNEGPDGVNLIDYSGNGNHGIINGAEWVQNTTLGDLNSDANIDILDIIILVQIIAFSGEYNELGDINGDGSLNILDAVALVILILNN